MSRIAYVNGRYLPHAAASVHIEDRGYQFADGVYEVIYVRDGNLVDEARHFERLERSLSELQIAMPMARAPLGVVVRQVVAKNRVTNGIVYLQVTRGAAPRDHAFPEHTRPALVVTARRMAGPSAEAMEEGVRVISVPDQRWPRCDIKSISLLPNVLAKQAAREAGAFEAWQVDVKGMVTEGSSTNAWIVDGESRLRTRALGNAILPGITRAAVMDLLAQAEVDAIEAPFSLDEAKAAREAFLTSTTSFVLPVVQIDDALVGKGKPGPLSRKLGELYARHMAGSDIAAEAAE
jgi:D-alanine transaminase